jgi:hypothetical protein
MTERKALHTNIDADLLKRLKIMAAEKDKAINELLEEILKDYFQKKRVLY